jgi:hypothetical protein
LIGQNIVSKKANASTKAPAYPFKISVGDKMGKRKEFTVSEDKCNRSQKKMKKTDISW